MPDTGDVAVDYVDREMQQALVVKTGAVAVVFRRPEGVTLAHVVLKDTTPLQAKQRLETEAELDLLSDDWAIAYYAGDKIVTGGTADLRDEAEMTLANFDPDAGPVTEQEVRELLAEYAS